MQRVCIITGRRGEGKTTCLYRIIELLVGQNRSVGGIITSSPNNDQYARKSSFSVTGIASGETRLLMQRSADEHYRLAVGRFFLDPDVLKWAETVIRNDAPSAKFLAIDEIGSLELNGSGYAEVLRELVRDYAGTLLLTIRDSNIDACLQAFDLISKRVCRISCSTEAKELDRLFRFSNPDTHTPGEDTR